jgi:hypothetical protein
MFAAFVVSLCLCGSAGATITVRTFIGTDLGAIPDGPAGPCGTAGSARNVHFAVTGITGEIQDVSVQFTLSPSHEWLGDLDAVLDPPGIFAVGQRLFGRVGVTTPTGPGDPSDLGGPISISDDAPAAPALWEAAQATGGPVPSSSYRASTIGGSTSGGQPTLITPSFASLTNPNGTWTLAFRDYCVGQTGTVDSAALFIRYGDPAPPLGQEVLYDNGPVATGATTDSGVTAPPGAQWSELQHPIGDLSEANALRGGSMGGNDRVVDDFTVPAGETWTIESFDAYGFDPSGPALPAPGKFVSATLRIGTAIPSAHPTTAPELFGDSSTNRLADLEPTDVYRIANTVAPAPTPSTTDGRIWRSTIEVEPPLTLPPGTYWADWAALTSGSPIAPFITVPGTRGPAGANGRGWTGAVGVWGPTIDFGLPSTAPDYPQDYAFRLRGTRVLDPQPPPAGDTTPPETTIDKAPKRKSRKRKAKIAFSANEPGATFTCAFNKKPLSACTSPVKVKGKRRGRNKFGVQATDAAGNTDQTPAVAKWKVRRKRR